MRPGSEWVGVREREWVSECGAVLRFARFAFNEFFIWFIKYSKHRIQIWLVYGMYASIRYIRLWIFGVFRWVWVSIYCTNARTEQPIHTYVVAAAVEFRVIFFSFFFVTLLDSAPLLCVCVHDTKPRHSILNQFCPWRVLPAKGRNRMGERVHTAHTSATSVVISVAMVVAAVVTVMVV